jgi:hypothetical protein
LFNSLGSRILDSKAAGRGLVSKQQDNKSGQGSPQQGGQKKA